MPQFRWIHRCWDFLNIGNITQQQCLQYTTHGTLSPASFTVYHVLRHFWSFSVTVDITNPVCKTCMILFIETSWPSPIQRLSSLFSFLFFRTGIVMKSTSCSSYKKECPQWMYTIIYLKKPTSFSSDFALALSICLCFYFCNICIHVGIYCCLMSHTSLITSEISHRSGRVQLMKSFIVVVFFCTVFSSQI